MHSLPKAEYWRPLVINYESVEKTTNSSFKDTRVPPITENEDEFILVKNQYASVSLCSYQLSKILRKFWLKYLNIPDQVNHTRRRLQTLKDVWTNIFRINTTPPSKLHQWVNLVCYCIKKSRAKINAVLSEIRTVEKYESITCRISTRWCGLSWLQKLQSKGYLSACGYLYIVWNLSITTTINEMQSTVSGQDTCQWFNLKLIWAKCKLPSQ